MLLLLINNELKKHRVELWVQSNHLADQASNKNKLTDNIINVMFAFGTVQLQFFMIKGGP